VFELGDDGRIAYAGRFDEDDFEGAYRELERRYYVSEGAAFAEWGNASHDWMLAMNRGDLDRAFGELSTPDLRIENRSRALFPDRSAAEFRSSLEELKAMVASVRTWISAACWVSPTWSVARFEREAIGLDGEQYAWTRLLVAGVRDGRLAFMCEYDLEDEEAAFAYAEERVGAASSRLAVANGASKIVEAGWLALRAHDLDGLIAVYSDRFEYDDRRRLSGDPIGNGAAMRAAIERILEQYSHFEWRTLAVRGELLELRRSRWWDDAGNETTYLHVFEIGDDGRVTYDGRFDEDDFEGAYRELERRYYAGEGAEFAEYGLLASESSIAMNQGDFDRLFGELCTPDLHLENRSRSAFPDRSASDLHASILDLNTMVASTQTWMSAVRWLSSACSIVRLEREAVGQDGEQYAWTRLLVTGHRDGRFASMCEFDLEDEKAAFAYAEERMRLSE
jgi:hypothetical protein